MFLTKTSILIFCIGIGVILVISYLAIWRKLKKIFPTVQNPYTIENHQVQVSEYASPDLKSIIQTINRYLEQNANTLPDFNVLKDIVERQVSMRLESIQQMIGIPIYIGLLGTIIGIVLGFLDISSIDYEVSSEFDSQKVGEGIKMLISNIMPSMSISFFGIFFTIINIWGFKELKKHTEEGKNKLYNFLQTELLPIINVGLPEAMQNFQKAVVSFSKDLSEQIKPLSQMLDKNFQLVQETNNLFENINQTQFAEIASYNMEVAHRMQESLAQINKLAKYVSTINTFIEKANELVAQANLYNERTGSFQIIASNIQSNLNTHGELLKFLTEHFHMLENHKKAINDTFQTEILTLENNNQTYIDTLQRIYETNYKNAEKSSELMNGIIKGIDEELANIKLKLANPFDAIVEKMNEYFAELRAIMKQRMDELQQIVPDEKIKKVIQEATLHALEPILALWQQQHEAFNNLYAELQNQRSTNLENQNKFLESLKNQLEIWQQQLEFLKNLQKELLAVKDVETDYQKKFLESFQFQQELWKQQQEQLIQQQELLKSLYNLVQTNKEAENAYPQMLLETLRHQNETLKSIQTTLAQNAKPEQNQPKTFWQKLKSLFKRDAA